jgi:purine-binding chemotaxis protein CheW
MAQVVRGRVEKRPVRRAAEGGKRTEYLAFGLAGEVYAVAIAHIAEILRLLPMTEVPRAPRTVRGIISVRGKLVTVVDLRRRLGLADGAIDSKARILLADANTGEQVGLLVDEVQQVWRLSAEEIEPAAVLGGDQLPHIAGIGRPADSGGAILILLELGPIVESP